MKITAIRLNVPAKLIELMGDPFDFLGIPVT